MCHICVRYAFGCVLSLYVIYIDPISYVLSFFVNDMCVHIESNVSHAGERGLVQRAEGTQQLKIRLQKIQK